MPIGAWTFCWTMVVVASYVAIVVMSECGLPKKNDLLGYAILTCGIVIIGGIFLMWRP